MTSFKQIRKERFLASLGANEDSGDFRANDDEAEKRRRRQGKVLQFVQSSPKRLSAVGLQTNSYTNGMSNEMLAEHYTECIQLSTENKITVKNAFALHLIDYMAEMITRKDSQLNNFQVASCTLDASTKIYSYRVDCVHADTLKIASGLIHSLDDKGSKRTNAEMGPDEDNESEDAPTKKKRVKRGRTIEINLNNINTQKLDMRTDIDPVFNKLSTKFLEDGASAGVFLTSLQHYNQDYGLILNSQAPYRYTREPNDDEDEGGEQDITELAPLFMMINKTGRICPAFDGFNFDTWKIGDKMPIDSMLQQDDLHESILETDDHFEGDMNNDESVHQSNSGSGNGATGSDAPFESLFDRMDSEGLKHVLSTEPSEYSYFKPQFLSAWAGPDHWRINPRSRFTAGNDSKKVKNTRTKKTPIVIDFIKEIEVEMFFKRTKAGPWLAKSTRQCWCEKKTSIFQDGHYDEKSLLQLFLKPQITVQFRESVISKEDHTLGDYNYQNANDVDNFCPPSEMLKSQFDENDDADGNFPMTQPDYDDDNQANVFTGENLLDKPFQVPTFQIPYPRTAKIVNVRHVKRSIWKWIENKSNTNDEISVNKFTELYADLPNLVTTKTAKNLSVAIALNCLLHLANDKTLKIQSNETYDDLTIELDAPMETVQESDH